MTDNVHALPNGADSVREQLKPDIDLAAALLLPNPDVLESRGQQLAIPVVNKPGPLEFFRTHPSLRLTLKMVTPDKGQPGAHSYAVLPAVEPVPGETGVDQIAPACLEPSERSFLVRPHQARIAGDIGGNNRNELPFSSLIRCGA
jgi:hypothetical protein